METRTAQLEVCWARAHDSRARGKIRRVGFMVVMTAVWWWWALVVGFLSWVFGGFRVGGSARVNT